MTLPLENQHAHLHESQMDFVYVVGNSRSGTTITAHSLGRHPLIFAFKELHFFEQLWQSDDHPLARAEAIQLIARLFAIQRHSYYYQGDANAYLDEATAVFNCLPSESYTPSGIFACFLRYETKRCGNEIACLQTPRNVYYLPEIVAIYPTACAVNMVRDARAVLLSQKGRWKGKFFGERRIPLRHILRTWAGYNPLTISLLWRGGIRAADRMADHPRVQTVRFEDLVLTSAEVVTGLCDFIGVPFELSMLDVPQINSSNRANQESQSGFDPSIAERWRQGGLNNTEIWICQQLTRRDMAAHGYEMENIRPNLLLLIYYVLIWPFKLGLALLLNADRMGKIIPSIKRRLFG